MTVYKISKKAIQETKLYLCKTTKDFFNRYYSRFGLIGNYNIVKQEIALTDIDKMMSEGSIFVKISSTVKMQDIKEYAELKEFTIYFVPVKEYKAIYNHVR